MFVVLSAMTANEKTRLAVAGACFLIALVIGLFNAIWAIQAARSSRRGERGPSLVPLVMTVMALIAGVAAPRWSLRWIPALLVPPDIGTLQLFFSSFRRRKTPHDRL